VRTYSIGFAAAEFDETGYARTAARHFGADPRFHTLGPEAVVEAVPVIARHYDEPFGNESAVPTFHCASVARADGYGVMLAGDGGDELFGGNARYAKQKVFELYGAIPAPLRRWGIEPLVFGGPAASLAPLRKARSYIEQARVPLPDRIETYNFLQRLPLAEILDPDFLRGIDPDEPLRLMRDQYRDSASSSAVNSMLHLDLKHVLADNDLRKVTRMCEAAGVEARFPLLDEPIIAFAAALPAELKVRGFTLRYFFKRALRDFLPVEILRKKKHGFGLPFGLWLREHPALADAAYESLTAFARRGYVRKAYVERLIAEHRSGHATYFGSMIWVLMTAEQWLSVRRL
jgi:asparagine synthase (glutamine-hydrolysing)